MKLSEMSKYCESIKINCDVCQHKGSCNRMTSFLEEQSPYGVVKAVKEDKDF